MTRIAVLGAGGMLGHDLLDVLHPYDVVGFTRNQVDITKPEEVRESLSGFDVVINAAAYTAVDDAEAHRDKAFLVNKTGAENVAKACQEFGQSLIHVSTDYVFDGKETQPYSEDTPLNPTSAYGASKAAGEQAVLSLLPEKSIIIRTAWLYGEFGPNFVETMLRLASERETVSVVTDQIGQPTWSRDLASMIRLLIENNVEHGVFHGTNAGQTSWFDFARDIFKHAGLNPERVLPTTSELFQRPAPRPQWSVLGHENWTKQGLPQPRSWESAFNEAWTTIFSSR